MKKWEDPEIWELAVEDTEASLTGSGEDHQRVQAGGYSLWGNDPS